MNKFFIVLRCFVVVGATAMAANFIRDWNPFLFAVNVYAAMFALYNLVATPEDK